MSDTLTYFVMKVHCKTFIVECVAHFLHIIGAVLTVCLTMEKLNPSMHSVTERSVLRYAF